MKCLEFGIMVTMVTNVSDYYIMVIYKVNKHLMYTYLFLKSIKHSLCGLRVGVLLLSRCHYPT